MCAVDGESKYSCVIATKENEPICEIGFKSITLLCRFLDQFNFDNGYCSIIKLPEHEILDPILLLDIWRYN